jgi:hypothetical protein
MVEPPVPCFVFFRGKPRIILLVGVSHTNWNNFMQNITVNAGFLKFRTNKFFVPVVVLVILIVASLVFLSLRKSPSAASVRIPITESTLEEEYGLHVNLVAITGAGGFVDVRFKIMDGEKAKAFLADKKNFPALLVNDDLVLNASEDAKSQEIRFNDDGNIFLLYVNSVNAVKRGSQLRILFGDIVLDPITVR